jgi:hypothetical protein
MTSTTCLEAYHLYYLSPLDMTLSGFAEPEHEGRQGWRVRACGDKHEKCCEHVL